MICMHRDAVPLLPKKKGLPGSTVRVVAAPSRPVLSMSPEIAALRSPAHLERPASASQPRRHDPISPNATKRRWMDPPHPSAASDAVAWRGALPPACPESGTLRRRSSTRRLRARAAARCSALLCRPPARRRFPPSQRPDHRVRARAGIITAEPESLQHHPLLFGSGNYFSGRFLSRPQPDRNGDGTATRYATIYDGGVRVQRAMYKVLFRSIFFIFFVFI